MPNASPTPARVLIVGVSTRAMAESAARAGYEVTAIDAFGDLDQHPRVTALSLPRDFGVAFSADAVAKASRTIACDAVAYLSPFENHSSAVATVAHGRALWGNGPAVLNRAREPQPIATAVDVRSSRWLVKPRASGGGHGIRWWTPGEPVPCGAYTQPFIDGVPSSIVFVAANGRAVPFGLTRQLVGDKQFGADGFRYCGSILTRESSAATELADVAARELGLVGVNCIDFINQAGGAIPIEINPRWSASMELAERAYGISVFGFHATACATGELPAFDLSRVQPTRTVGKAIVFARHNLTCGDTRPWLDDTTVRDIPHPGEHIAAGRPVCTVFAEADEVDSCYAALVDRARRVYQSVEAWSSVAV